jgi:acetate---CoA ligase (ADP-forming)
MTDAMMEAATRAAVVSPSRLRAFFSPRSMAVVGCSESSSWARWLLNSIELPGRDAMTVIPVNPNRSHVFGKRAVPSLSALPHPVDLAFIMTPAHTVEAILEEVASAGIRNAVVLASGFADAGAEGRQRQERLAARAAELNVTLLGPNTTGFVNVAAGAAPWAVAVSPPLLAGPVAGVFESGSITRAAFEFAQAHAIGTSLWVSVGNGSLVSTMDILEYLLEDDATRAIILFLESLREPERFKRLAQQASERGKPIVAMKTGRSDIAKRAGQAHTGALATDDAIVDAAMRQYGVVRAHSLEELIATAGLFAYSPRLPSGRRMGVVTSSGGGCSIVADRAEEDGLLLPSYAPATLERLAERLPPYATLSNPLDVTGAGNTIDRGRPTKAEDDLLEIAAADPGIDFMFSLMNASFLAARTSNTNTNTPGVVRPAGTVDAVSVPTEGRLGILGEIVANSPVPVFLASSTCLDIGASQREMLMQSGIHLLPGVELAMTALGHACWWTEQRRRQVGARTEAPTPAEVPADVCWGGDTWPEDLGRSLLSAHGVPVVPAVLVTSAESARAAAQRFGGPVAVKVCSAEIAHKSDVGGVKLNVSPTEAGVAFDEILRSVSLRAPHAAVRGCLVSPMRGSGVELLVSVTADPTLGKVLTLALGGVWVEALNDASIRLLPVERDDVRTMLSELRGKQLLMGGRGTTLTDLERLVDAVLGIARTATHLGARLQTLEVNPLLVRGAEIEVLDVLISAGSDQGSCDRDQRAPVGDAATKY